MTVLIVLVMIIVFRLMVIVLSSTSWMTVLFKTRRRRFIRVVICLLPFWVIGLSLTRVSGRRCRSFLALT